MMSVGVLHSLGLRTTTLKHLFSFEILLRTGLNCAVDEYDTLFKVIDNDHEQA